jgi:outer membrane protein OmpA-like peptidoglycan-associated protein/uncharacterized protein YegL
MAHVIKFYLRILVFACTTYLPFNVFGQLEYESLFEKRQFEKIDKKIQKDLLKKPSDPFLLYTAAYLYNEKEFLRHDFYKAYKYCEKGDIALKNVTDKKTIKKINEINLNVELFLNLSQRTCSNEFEDLSLNKEFSRAQRFLDEFTNASRNEKASAEIIRDEMALKKAKEEQTVEGFDYFISTYPNSSFINEAVKLRDRRALDIAKSTNSLSELEGFIFKYPRSIYLDEAVNFRDNIALSDAKKINTEQAYTQFIDKYPRSIYLKEAKDLRIESAYHEAIEQATTDAYKAYCTNYPNSKYYNELNRMYNEIIFRDVLKVKTFSALFDYIRQNPNSHLLNEATLEMNRLHYAENCSGSKSDLMKYVKNFADKFSYPQALDTLYLMCSNSKDFEVFDFILRELPRNKYTAECADFIINAARKSGDYNLISEIAKRHGKSFQQIYSNTNEIEFSKEEQDLHMEVGCNYANEYSYDLFIQKRANTDIGFVALQRIIEENISKKKFQLASSKLSNYRSSFNEAPYTLWLDGLDSILNAPSQNIVISPEKDINSLNEEMNPIPSFDGKSLFFCGKSRKDNIGGEDIFISQMGKSKTFTNAKTIKSICTSNNEAPVSISADGNTLITWSSNGSGDIYFSSKMANGEYSSPMPFPAPINLPYSYEADAMLTADGKGMFFISNREGGFNYSGRNSGVTFHGDNNYSTDIYFSHLLPNNQWSEPVTLDGNINSPYAERSPYLHPDGKTLYFSSDGHGGLGRMDVFKSTLLFENDYIHWNTPENLGKEINTAKNDWGFKFSTDGTKAYFSSESGQKNESSVILLLDVSGSMQGNKIESLKTSAKETAEFSIQNNSEIAILAFDGTPQIPIKYYLPFSRDLKNIFNFIEGLQAVGSTPMYQAYSEACQYMKNFSSSSSKSKSIILMTDGVADQSVPLQAKLQEVKSKGLIYPTQCIALEVPQNSQAYIDLNTIAVFSKGKLFHAERAAQLNVAFAEASKEIYSFNSQTTNRDIYSIELPIYLRPGMVATISGKLKDSKDQPVSAKMKWEDLESNREVGESKSDPTDGSFFIALPVGKNYGYYAETKDYYPLSGNVDLRQETKGIQIIEEFKLVSFEELKSKNVSVTINNVFFDFGKYDLLPASILELNRFANIINTYQRKIEISGHTDNVGDDSDNLVLSERRAESVRNYLISIGCKPELLFSKGYGEAKPSYSNDTDNNRAKNRRVEFKFID